MGASAPPASGGIVVEAALCQNAGDGGGERALRIPFTNFTLEDFIAKAGLEVKVNRKYYKLEKIDKEIKVAGARGQALGQKVEKYERRELANLATLRSGDLVEIEACRKLAKTKAWRVTRLIEKAKDI